MSVFPDRLKVMRDARRFTQEEVAARANVPLRMYQRYETGKNSPTLDVVIRLADALETSTDYLAGRVDDPTPPNEIYTQEEREIVELLRRQRERAAKAENPTNNPLLKPT